MYDEDLDEVVFTVEEVAGLLRVGRNTVYRAIKREELPALKLGRRLLVPRPALERVLGLIGPDPDNDEDAMLARFRERRRLWRGRS